MAVFEQKYANNRQMPFIIENAGTISISKLKCDLADR